MTNETRGEAIRVRRMRLGIRGYRDFAEASGFDKGTLQRAETGRASDATYENLEAWLTGQEIELGLDVAPAEPTAPIRLTLHGVYGVEELILEGPVDHPEEIAEAVGKILDRLKAREE